MVNERVLRQKGEMYMRSKRCHMDGPSVAWICTRTRAGNIIKLCGC